TMSEQTSDEGVLDFFGKWIMQQVRDPSIAGADRIIDGHSIAAYKPLSDELKTSLTQEQRNLVKRLVPEIVDLMLHHLLWSVEQTSTIEVDVHADNTTVSNIVEISDGLSGELYGSKGWTHRFSRERDYQKRKVRILSSTLTIPLARFASALDCAKTV